MTVFAWALVALSIALIRLGWHGRKPVALAGWALAATSLVLLAQSDGAWGIATGFTLGIAIALALVLHAGWQSPPRLSRAPRQAAATVRLPHGSRDFGRRVAVFVLVVPIAFIAAQWLAYATQLSIRDGAPLDADSLALTLFLQPVLWAVLMSWQMVLSTPVRMLAPPLIAAALGAILWGLA